MSYKIVWKLCDMEDGKLVSAVAYTEEMKLEYKIGGSTKPKVGLMFAFKTKEYAFNGKNTINNYSVVVKCKARISKIPVPDKVAFFEYYNEYWNAVFRKIPNYSSGWRSMPPGTLFCTEIIPIEIDDEREEK